MPDERYAVNDVLLIHPLSAARGSQSGTVGQCRLEQLTHRESFADDPASSSSHAGLMGVFHREDAVGLSVGYEIFHTENSHYISFSYVKSVIPPLAPFVLFPILSYSLKVAKVLAAHNGNWVMSREMTLGGLMRAG